MNSSLSAWKSLNVDETKIRIVFHPDRLTISLSLPARLDSMVRETSSQTDDTS